MPDELSHVVVEAAASRRLVEKFMVNDEAHVHSRDPTVLFPFVLEPLIKFGKLAVVEVSSRDANAIDVATGLVECVIGQRVPCHTDSAPPYTSKRVPRCGTPRTRRFHGPRVERGPGR